MYYNRSGQDVLKELDSDSSIGLTTNKVDERIKKYGYNKLSGKKKKSTLQLFLAQLNDILIYILIVAAVLSVVVGKEFSDAIIITIVILINATVGVIQESKAEKALDALKAMSTPKALVKRNGETIEIPSEEVVPGDIIVLDAGRYIPCDLRLIESANLKIEESALTGESVPVEKDSNLILTEDNISLGDKKNMAFMSTLVTYGRGTGVAVATGMNTEIGKIANMLDSSENELTPLQKKLEQLGKILGIAAIAICIIMFFTGLLQGRSITSMFMISISLAVAAIPEGLAAIVTIVLAMGVQRMIEKNAIIRKLPSVETLGSVNIICSDKTGTLTQNKMTVMKFYVDNDLTDAENLNLSEEGPLLLLKNLILCNDATSTPDSKTGDPTEIALLDIGLKYNLSKENLSKDHVRTGEVPFDSDRKLMTTINTYNDKFMVFTKGAADNLLNICNKILIKGNLYDLTENYKAQIMDASTKMSNDALRVLGCAYKVCDSTDSALENAESSLTFIGLVGMIDPPRLEVKDSIETCKKSGIKTIMITGDHKNTAYAIAKELSIADNIHEVINGSELDSLTDDMLKEKCKKLKVFARVSPEHKVRIVKAFKSLDNIVSMTGDGVNDAPSLKSADIGVAMGITGTDVAKGASDMVLTDDNFSTIVTAIEEGRNIYNNIKKAVLFLISCNLGEIVTLFLGILLGFAAPLNATHILWVNLITDSFPALALGIDPGDKDIMKNPPRNPKDSLFKDSVFTLCFNGVLIGLLTLIGFGYGVFAYGGAGSTLKNIADNPQVLIHAQTIAFVVLSGTQLVHGLNMRSQNKSIFSIGIFSNIYLIGAIIIGIALQVAVIYIPVFATLFNVTPLNLKDWIVVLALSLLPLILNEIIKIFRRK